MYYYLIAPSTLVRKDEQTFTYHSQNPLAIGAIVRVPIGKKQVSGVVITATTKPSFNTKAIDTIVSQRPLPKPLIELAFWLSEYYSTHLALVLQTILPAGVHKKRRQANFEFISPARIRTKIVLNEQQRRAVLLLQKQRSATVLLHGVTGSGKTQVYIEAAKHQQRQGRSSIILVPEIALTPQLVAEFAQHFKNIAITHSHMTEAERHLVWQKILNTEESQVIIGPRSALFMPVHNLGLIVVDECHEPSYKQEQSPRYSALRAASKLVRLHDNAKAIFGSATPTVVDYYLAKTTKSPILKLPVAVQAAQTATTIVIDLKDRDAFKQHHFLSDTLIKSMRDALDKKQQILLFHNRRGTAPTTMCTQCGWLALCDNCHIPLTLHADKHRLLCHFCGKVSNVPSNCPECRFPDIVFKGIGTKLIENEVRKLFPKTQIARFDGDNKLEESVQANYQQLYDGEISIMIGTQLLAKGLDLPNLRVVGVVQADSGLTLPDYQAKERTFQLLHQAAGRVGRGQGASEVIIQAYQPQHPIIRQALSKDYSLFYEQQIRERHEHMFPPFTYLLKLVCSYKTEKHAIQAAKNMADLLRSQHKDIVVLGPIPAFYERLGGSYRWQLNIKSKQRGTLVKITKALPAHWQGELDPISLL